MRILVVNVNTTETMTETIADQTRSVAAQGAEIVGLTPFIGADSVEGNYGSYLAAIGVMDRVLPYHDPYDAVIQAGFGEHGRDGLQELLDVPVVDITEAAALSAPAPGGVVRATQQGSRRRRGPCVITAHRPLDASWTTSYGFRTSE